MHQENLSPITTRHRWSRARLMAGTLALTVGVLGAGLAATALPAYAAVTSNQYTIGTPTSGVSSVSATPTSVNANANTLFLVTFTTPSALAGSSSSSITVATSPSTETLGAAPTNIALTGGSCVQGGTAGVGGAGGTSVSGVTIFLNSTCSIAAGTRVTVSFNANAPAAQGSFFFAVSTSSNVTAENSNSIAVGTGLATLTASNTNVGVNATYSIGSLPTAGFTDTVTSIGLKAVATSGTGTIAFTTGAASYHVTYTPPGGTATNDPVTAVTAASPAAVTLTVANGIVAGGKLSIVATGTNPSTAATNEITVTPAGGTTETTSPVSFGSSVSNVVVTPSSLVAGTATLYTVSFKASSAVAVGGNIVLSESAGPTNFSTVTGIAVTDATQNTRFVSTSFTVGAGGSSVTIPLSNPIVAGDSISLILANVTNPSSSQTVSDFNVTTSGDTVPRSATPYTIGGNASSGVVVTPNPNTVGSLSTYTITGLHASAALAGGSSTISIVGPAGTVFPANAASYSITDATTGTGTGTVTAAVSGGGTNSVTITVPNNINSGDALSLTILTVINPSTASSTYTVSFGGNVSGPAARAAVPASNLTYPNGGIVNFSGTLYVFAGGRAFGIAGQSQLTALQKVNKATTQDAIGGTSAPTTATPRAGTLLFTRPVNGAATIYVVGTDGELHGFSTPAQFTKDGYDGALVVTVTTLGGLKVGSTVGQGGAADNALGTKADGALVNSGGHYYTFAGGRAFHITTGTELATIKKTNKAKILTGSVTSADQSAAIASGTLLTVAGPAYVTYKGEAWPFKSMTQLHNAGYGGTAAVPVPSTGGLTVVNY